MTDAGPYGYDPATDTVRVSRHDLARLLLEFRSTIERFATGPDRQWGHMADYDLSFERLADAVDYGRAHWPLAGRAERGPDYRMRCKRTPAYAWPEHAPYNGQQPEAVAIRPERRHGSHYMSRIGQQEGMTLCGARFYLDESTPAVGDPSCLECLRERALAEALVSGA